MRVVIRPAKNGDRRAIQRLVKMYPGQLRQDDLPQTREFFLGVCEGKIVGCCALSVYRFELAEIRSLAVDRAYQKLGVGRRLVRACLAEARRMRIRRVFSITSKLRFFKRFGLKPFQGEKYALFLRLR